MSKFTAGPWIVDGEKGEYVSPLDRHDKIAIASILCIDDEDTESGDWVRGEETNANARLIAAAPDLLHALQNIENDNGQIPDHAWKVIQDALQKLQQFNNLYTILTK